MGSVAARKDDIIWRVAAHEGDIIWCVAAVRPHGGFYEKNTFDFNQHSVYADPDAWQYFFIASSQRNLF